METRLLVCVEHGDEFATDVDIGITGTAHRADARYREQQAHDR
jgi:hypothetical protein